jgi:hypothetical protein
MRSKQRAAHEAEQALSAITCRLLRFAACRARLARLYQAIAPARFNRASSESSIPTSSRRICSLS